MKTLDVQHGGSHYKSLAIQPAEYNQKNKLGFSEGSVIKYTTRHKQKGGAVDLKKAIHFLTIILESEYGVVASVSFDDKKEAVVATQQKMGNNDIPLRSQWMAVYLHPDGKNESYAIKWGGAGQHGQYALDGIYEVGDGQTLEQCLQAAMERADLLNSRGTKPTEIKDE